MQTCCKVITFSKIKIIHLVMHSTTESHTVVMQIEQNVSITTDVWKIDVYPFIIYYMITASQHRFGLKYQNQKI